MQKKLLIGALVVVVLIAATYGAMAATSTANFCSNCHYIKPAVEAWRTGAHNQVACLDCHADPGPVGYVKRKIGAYHEIALHVTEKYPEDLQARVNIENCILCHSGNYKDEYPKAKNITITGAEAEVSFNHQAIIEAKTSCLDCHEQVAHGTLNEDK